MSGQYCLDANIFLTAWYVSYPPQILSSLWDQIAKHHNDIVFFKPVFDEIEPIASSDNKLSRELKERKYQFT